MSKRRTPAANGFTASAGTVRGSAAPSRLSPADAVFMKSFMAYYTAITSTRAGNRKRIQIEYGNEEKTQLKPFDRLEAIAIGRDLNRNNPKAITIIEQKKVLTAGKVRAQFNTDSDNWNEAADKIFNRYFARDCFHEYPAHLSEIAQMVEAAKMREGDILIAYDDEFLFDTGKLMIWEADQLVTVQATDWESEIKNPDWRYTEMLPGGVKKSTAFFQDQGVIVDQYKRVVGYVVSALHCADEKRANTALPLEDVLIIPADAARLICNRFRLGQRRGVPSLLPVAGNLADIDEMLKSELSTARLRSKIMAFVKRRSESGMRTDEEAVAEALALAASASAGSGAAEPAAADAGTVEVRKAYKSVQEATGGLVEYLDDDDDIDIPAIDRPNLDTSTFYDSLGDTAGASQGLARAYTRMAATSSYTAHRGETCMTDRHIRNGQKKHEHDWLDWLAERVIRRAIRQGKLANGPEDWQYLISWDMPRPDAIDPEKEARAEALDMKNGKKNLRDIIGPSWKRRLEETAKQLKEALRLGIPLSIFETVAGAASAALGKNKNAQTNGGDGDDER